MRISDWSSDVCSSDLGAGARLSGAAWRDPAAIRRRGRGARNRPGARMMLAILAAGPAVTERVADTPTDTLLFEGAILLGVATLFVKIGSASCRERVCQYV